MISRSTDWLKLKGPTVSCFGKCRWRKGHSQTLRWKWQFYIAFLEVILAVPIKKLNGYDPLIQDEFYFQGSTTGNDEIIADSCFWDATQPLKRMESSHVF